MEINWKARMKRVRDDLAQSQFIHYKPKWVLREDYAIYIEHIMAFIRGEIVLDVKLCCIEVCII